MAESTVWNHLVAYVEQRISRKLPPMSIPSQNTFHVLTLLSLRTYLTVDTRSATSVDSRAPKTGCTDHKSVIQHHNNTASPIGGEQHFMPHVRYPRYGSHWLAPNIDSRDGGATDTYWRPSLGLRLLIRSLLEADFTTGYDGCFIASVKTRT